MCVSASVCACLRLGIRSLAEAALCVYSFIKPNHPACRTPLCGPPPLPTPTPAPAAAHLFSSVLLFCFVFFLSIVTKNTPFARGIHRNPTLTPPLIGLIIHQLQRCVKVGVCVGGRGERHDTPHPRRVTTQSDNAVFLRGHPPHFHFLVASG